MSQSIQSSTLLAIPLAPLVASFVSGVFGTRMGGQLIGRRTCHLLTIAGVLLSFVLSVSVLIHVVDGARFNETLYTWMHVGNLRMEIGFLVDGLTALMMCVVTSVSLMVHIYTIGYMEEDEGYNRFFSYISLFTFAMLMLVMSNNMLQLFFGWEAVGLVSYLLIGFWFKKESAIFANMKAFLVNRVGDFGFILGIGLLVAHTGSLNYSEVFASREKLSGLVLPGTDWMLVTVACVCLFIGAMGKSAQFPLHVWLPDSMEGPTPISALIHAATMVTAGIFMVARMSPLFEMSDAALNFIVVIGSITALFMGFLGIIQNDIKRVVAYSTLSQLGYMTIALGVSAYNMAVFHLMTHAFFKALLFLAAGSVIIGMHHDQDIRNMGGLRRFMPITWITSLIGSLALIGTPLFSGFFSKDSIIEAVHLSHLPAASFATFAVLAGVFVTAFYSFRMYFLVFHGTARHASQESNHGNGGDYHGPHESPWVVTLPLVLLAIPSLVIGYLTIQPVLYGDFLSDALFVNHAEHGVMEHLSREFHGPIAMAVHSIQTLPFWLAMGGVVSAWYIYLFNNAVAVRLRSALFPLYRLLENKYYMDWVNEQVFARFARWLGDFLWLRADRRLIDGLFVNGSWRLAGAIAKLVSLLQSGHLNSYAFFMFFGIFAFVSVFVWLI